GRGPAGGDAGRDRGAVAPLRRPPRSRRPLARRRPRRVARRHRTLGIGQDDAPQHPRRPRPAERRLRAGRRHRSRRAVRPRPGRLPAADDRPDLPAVPSDPVPDRARERHARPVRPQHDRPRRGGGGARGSGARWPAPPPAEPALGRRAAESLHRPRPDQPPAADPRRRADRQPGRGQRGGRDAPAHRPPQGRPYPRFDHPRAGDRRARRPRDPARARPARPSGRDRRGRGADPRRALAAARRGRRDRLGRPARRRRSPRPRLPRLPRIAHRPDRQRPSPRRCRRPARAPGRAAPRPHPRPRRSGLRPGKADRRRLRGPGLHLPGSPRRMPARPAHPARPLLPGGRRPGGGGRAMTGWLLLAAFANALLGAPATGPDEQSPRPPASAPRPTEAVLARRLASMGTTLDLTVLAVDRPAAVAASERAVEALEAAERRLSTWRDDTELAAVNRAPVGAPVPLSKELARDLAAALDCARETGGAFDPTVGALVAAWGLRHGGRHPSDPEIEAALRATGFA